MSGFTTLLAMLCVLFVAILICREMYCWYCKINERLEVLRNIDANLAKLVMRGRENG